MWPLLTGGRCSKGALCYKDLNWDSKMVAAVAKLSLFLGRLLRFDCTFKTYFKVLPCLPSFNRDLDIQY